MSPTRRLAFIAVLVGAGCADDEAIPPVSIDAAVDGTVVDSAFVDASTDAISIDADPDAVPIDARIDAMSSVMVVTCPAAGSENLAILINASGSAFVPNTGTISVNGIVRFDPAGTFHNMISGTTPPQMPDGQFATPNSQVACLRFTAVGTYPFFCSIHGFAGSITVN